jgi:8-oxo-dGTP pyrophosphatase MutT (NUDIX family)
MAQPNRDRVAVLIIRQDKLLLFYRYRDGRTYYALPGGHVETGETLEETAIREIKEELNLDIDLDRKLWEITNGGRQEHYFLAAGFTGEIKLGFPELGKLSPQNVYRPEWIPLAELADIPLLPQEIKANIIAQVDDLRRLY